MIRFKLPARKGTPGFSAHVALYKRATTEFGNSHTWVSRGRIDLKEWPAVGYQRANDGRGTIIWFSRNPAGAMWLMAWKPEEGTWL